MLHPLIRIEKLRVRGLCANTDNRAISLIMNDETLYQDMMSLRNYIACRKALSGNPNREALYVFSDMMEPEKEIDTLSRNSTLYAIQMTLDYYADIVDWNIFGKTLCKWREMDDLKVAKKEYIRTFDDSFEGREIAESPKVEKVEKCDLYSLATQDETSLKIIDEYLKAQYTNEANECHPEWNVVKKDITFWQHLCRNTCPFVLSILFYSSETMEWIDWDILSSNPVIFV